MPLALREYAHLEKSIVLVGQGNKFEVWGEDLWLSERAKWLDEAIADDAIPEVMQNLSL